MDLSFVDVAGGLTVCPPVSFFCNYWDYFYNWIPWKIVSMKEPVRIDFETKKFKGASGKTYHIVDRLPIDYYIAYQELVPEVTFGVDFLTLFKTCRGAYDALFSGNEVMASVRKAGELLINQIDAIKKFKDKSREPAILKMAAVWCIREDEEFKVVDEQLQKEKIEDWKAAGIDMLDFFFLCGAKIDGFIEIYQEFQGRNERLNPA